MSQPSRDRDPLCEFIRQYSPEIPSASPDLEDRVMAAVKSDRTVRSQPQLHRRFLWIPPAIAASLAMAWGSNILFAPPPPTPTELAQIEVFMESTWDEVLGEEAISPSTDLFLPEESSHD